MSLRIAIIGCVGIPARYGGFETLAGRLVEHTDADKCLIYVYCQKSAYLDRTKEIGKHRRVFIPLRANGILSLLYDAVSIFDAIFMRHCEVICCLGASSALTMPLVRIFSPNVKIIFNLDGIESNRNKWSLFAKITLIFLEWLGVRCATQVVADNRVIQRYIKKKYRKTSVFIPYGGDVVRRNRKDFDGIQYPQNFFLSVSRVVPENNVHLILESFKDTDETIVYVGNWDASLYGRNLKKQYLSFKNIKLLNPIYDQTILDGYRENAKGCIHGHSVGGTNPALVEAIFWANKIFVFDCSFNRATLHSSYNYWKTVGELKNLLFRCDSIAAPAKARVDLLKKEYSWANVIQRYNELFEGVNNFV